MKINIVYNTNNEEPEILEIQFLRGNTLLHNVFYDISDLNPQEVSALKVEAIAKFCSCFPEIPKRDVIKGFSSVDPQMYNLYKKTFETRGGARINAGRKKGKKIGKIKAETTLFSRRVTKEEYTLLDEYLNKLRNE